MRPVAITCPHCGASLEVLIPIPLTARSTVQTELPEHYLAESSRVGVIFDLAGAEIPATLSPQCPLSGAKLRASATDVGRAVDSAVRRGA